MKIKNIENLSPEQIRNLVSQGGQFVMYTYCISIVVMSFRNATSVYFIKPGQSKVVPGLGALFTSFFLGWWGIPWGPIYTIGAIYTALSGGKDVTAQVMGHINQMDPTYGTSGYSVGSSSTYNIPT